MKKITISLFAVLALTVACNNKKGDADSEAASPAMKDTIAVDNTDVAVPEVPEQEEGGVTISGKVLEVQNGKDGYTAKLSGNEGAVYFATISIPNLDDPKQYRSVKVGETVTVSGEVFKVGEEDHIKVTVLQ